MGREWTQVKVRNLPKISPPEKFGEEKTSQGLFEAIVD